MRSVHRVQGHAVMANGPRGAARCARLLVAVGLADLVALAACTGQITQAGDGDQGPDSVDAGVGPDGSAAASCPGDDGGSALAFDGADDHVGIGSAFNSLGTPAGRMHGFIDEVRVWDRARTGEEIAATMFSAVSAGDGHLSPTRALGRR